MLRLKNIKLFLAKNSFFQSVFTLMLGSGLAQVIIIATAPILTRLYTPEHYGVFSIYLAIYSIATVLATGRYELAIVLPRSNDYAKHLVYLSIKIGLFLSVLSLVFIVLFGDSICKNLKVEFLGKWLYLIPLIIFLSAINQSMLYWHNRTSNYAKIAKSRVFQSAVCAICQLAYGIYQGRNISESGLILSNVAGLIISTAYLVRRVRKDKLKIRITKVLVLAKKYKNFPLFNMLNALIDTFRFSSITLIVSIMYSNEVLGQFYLAWRMSLLPINLITSSLSLPFYKRVSIATPVEAYNLTLQTILRMIKLSFFIYLMMYIFSPLVFKVVFGEKWEMAGSIVSNLTPWFFCSFITSPLSNIYSCYNKQNIMLIYSLIYAVIPLLFLITLQKVEFLLVISIISVVMSLFLVSYLLSTIFFLKRQCGK
ncbi:MAG: oligosaccharide flippase family protein [Methylococcales bacterium]|nr:oligosaccharide flippase family protein [Methylococcales bacterium]